MTDLMTQGRRRSGRVVVCTIESPPEMDLLRTPQQHIASKLFSGARITRYGRQWLLGGVTPTWDPESTPDGQITGRIGYEGADSDFTVWNEEEQDFFDYVVPTGHAAPFVVDLDLMKLAFQPRNPDIRVGATANAFASFLSDVSRQWSVRPDVQSYDLDSWLTSVQRVTRIRIWIRRPNPNWAGAQDIRQAVEEAEADVARFEFRNDGDGVNVNSPFVRQSLTHVDRGYGAARMTGNKPDGTEATFDSEAGAEDPVTEVPVDERTGEVSTATLREALADDDNSDQTG